MDKILKFLIDGAVDYYKNGLSTIPEVMEDEIEQDRRDLDSIYAFYTDMIEPADNGTRRLYCMRRIGITAGAMSLTIRNQ